MECLLPYTAERGRDEEEKANSKLYTLFALSAPVFCVIVSHTLFIECYRLYTISCFFWQP